MCNVCFEHTSIFSDKIIANTPKVSLRKSVGDPSLNFDILKTGFYYSTDTPRGPAISFLKDVANVWYCSNFNFDSNISKEIILKEIYPVKRQRTSVLNSIF